MNSKKIQKKQLNKLAKTMQDMNEEEIDKNGYLFGKQIDTLEIK